MQIDTQLIVVIAIVVLAVALAAWLIVRNLRASRAERQRLADLAARQQARRDALALASANGIAILDLSGTTTHATPD